MRLPIDLDGPAPVWPRPLDAALEWWAGLSGRGRVALRGVALAIGVLAATGGLLQGPWGPPQPVLVAVRDLAPGSTVTADDVRLGRWPRDLVPSGALRSTTDLPDAGVAHGALTAGAVLTTGNVRAPDAVALPGTAVVPVPADVLPALPVGTTVDVAATTLDGTARVVARAATVVADDGAWRWLRVERGEVGGLAAGVGNGQLVAAIVSADCVTHTADAVSPGCTSAQSD